VTMVVSCILLLLVLSLAEAGFSADKPAVWLGKTYQIMWDQNHGKQSYYPPPDDNGHRLVSITGNTIRII